MERLTNKNEYGYYPIPFEFNGVNGSYDIYDPEELEAQVYRLAEIEDILGDDYDLDRLRDLVQADREGRCVVLPCREGDTVYRIVEDQFECNAEDAADPFMPTAEIVEEPFHISNFYDFGLFLFLNRAEAEDALRRAQDG